MHWIASCADECRQRGGYSGDSKFSYETCTISGLVPEGDLVFFRPISPFSSPGGRKNSPRKEILKNIIFSFFSFSYLIDPSESFYPPLNAPK